MTTDAKQNIFCMKCGYQLVGRPLSTRCSECGYPVVYQARWCESELHRAGPLIVWPITRRLVVAALLLGFSLLAALFLYGEVLNKLQLIKFSTASWALIPFFIIAPIAAFCWQTCINGPGSDLWCLNKQATQRVWVLPCSLLFWIVAYFSISGISAAQQQVGVRLSPQVTTQNLFDQIATFALVPAIALWSVVLFHVSRISLYLRNVFLRRVWIGVYCFMLLVSVPFIFVIYINKKFEIVEFYVLILAWITLFISVLFAAFVAWDMANCLTHSYETMAREERLTKQNSRRYSTPK